MAIRRYDPIRAVEICSPTYGSGYRIGGRLVLTAKHLVGKAGAKCTVRLSGSTHWQSHETEATVAWVAHDGDVAVVELPATADPVDAVVLGMVPADVVSGSIPYEMYAWPEWAQTKHPSHGALAGGRDLPGEIFLADRSAEERLVLEPRRQPGMPSAPAGVSPWQGASGAAVICDGLVVAVQHSHQRPDRSASLEAEPIALFRNDPELGCLLAAHGISNQLEFVDVENATSRPQPPIDLSPIELTEQNRFHFRSQGIPFVGRVKEHSLLHTFLKADQPFLWWLLTGAAGSGKSRLAFDLCCKVKDKWRAGFLPPDAEFQEWREWEPLRPTLLVVDYVRSRTTEMQRAISTLHDRRHALGKPVRFLFLERFAGPWLHELCGSGTAELKAKATQFQDPLLLEAMSDEDQRALITALGAADAAIDAAGEKCPSSPALDDHWQGRPLLVALAAHLQKGGEQVAGLSVQELIERHLQRDQRLIWDPAGVTIEDRNLLALVTMISGRKASVETRLSEQLRWLIQSSARGLLPNFTTADTAGVLSRYSTMVGMPVTGPLLPLEPDLFGELFVLGHVSPTSDPLGARAESLCKAAWSLSPIGFASFIHRTAEDYPQHQGIDVIDRRWGDSRIDKNIIATNFFFRLDGMAKQGKFERLLHEYQEILGWAREPGDPELYSAVEMIIHDLVKVFVEHHRGSDAEHAYEAFRTFAIETKGEDAYNEILAVAEHDLIVLGAMDKDQNPQLKMWPRLYQRALNASSMYISEQAAWSGHDFIVALSRKVPSIALAVFKDMVRLVDAKKDTPPGEDASVLNEMRGALLRCASSLVSACLTGGDFDGGTFALVEATHRLPAADGAEPEISNLPPIRLCIDNLASRALELVEALCSTGRLESTPSVLRTCAVLLEHSHNVDDVAAVLSAAANHAVKHASEQKRWDLIVEFAQILHATADSHPHDEGLREITAYCHMLGVTVIECRPSEADAPLLVARDQLKALCDLVLERARAGHDANRKRIWIASFIVAARELQIGYRDEAANTLARALDVGGKAVALAWLGEHFGREGVQALVADLGDLLKQDS